MCRRRRLGQHKLVDEDVVAMIMERAAISRDESVFEIGSGEGVLTEHLCRRARRVTAYEIDRRLYETCRVKLSHFRNLRLVCGDGLEMKSRFDVLVASLPYSQSSRFVEWLAERRFKRAVVLVQKEFAEKLLASPGSRSFRAMSVLAQHAFKIRMVGGVSRSSFEPPPKVDSTILLMEPAGRRLKADEALWLKRLFSFRGRRLSSALKSISKSLGIGVDMFAKFNGRILSRRVEDLDVNEVVNVSKTISEAACRS